MRRFGLKMGKDFAHFGVQSGIVFEGLLECINVFLISIPNVMERKKNARIRNEF